ASPFFFSSRRRHTSLPGDWSSDVCSSDLVAVAGVRREGGFSVGGGGDQRGRSDHAQLFGQEGEDGGAAFEPGRDRRHFPSGVLEIGRASCRERVETSQGGRRVCQKRPTVR